jgi:hypothetical protein
LKNLAINSFEVPLFSSGVERIHNANLSQYDGSEVSNEGYLYHYKLDGKYSSEYFDFSHNYTIELLSDVIFSTYGSTRKLHNLRGAIGLVSSVNDDRVSLGLSAQGVTLTSNVGEDLFAYHEDLFDGQIVGSRPLNLMQPDSLPQIIAITHDGDLSKLNSEGMSIYFDRLVGPEEGEIFMNYPTGLVMDNRIKFEEADILSRDSLNNSPDFFTLKLYVTIDLYSPVKFNELERYNGPIPFINSEFGTVTPMELIAKSFKYNKNGFYFGRSSSRSRLPNAINTFDLNGKYQSNFVGYDFDEFCFNENSGEIFFWESHENGIVIKGLNSNFELTSETLLNTDDVNVECEHNQIKIFDTSNEIPYVFNMGSKDLYTFDVDSLTSEEKRYFELPYYWTTIPNSGERLIIQRNEVVTINDEQREVALFVYEKNQSGSFELSPLMSLNTSLITEKTYNEENKIFSDNVNNRVYKDDWVLNLDENTIIKPFTSFVFRGGQLETVVGFNSSLNVIITTYGLYDAVDFSLLTRLPLKLKDVEHDDWFTGDNQRICAGLEDYLIYCSRPIPELRQ